MSDKERLIAASGPLLSWYHENKRDLPWRKNHDAYWVWVSEIMLQQTRVEAAKPYYERFMERFPAVRDLAEVPEDELLKYWEGLGYYSRARNLKKAAQVVVEQYDGVFPKTPKELENLPGIGSYTAGAVASIAYEVPVPAVDGNVLRVISRVLGSREDIAKQTTKQDMTRLLTEVLTNVKERGKRVGDFNQALMETGALICLPNGDPLCMLCAFRPFCLAAQNGLTDEIPVKTAPKKRKIEEKTVLLLEFEDKIAIRKRKEEGLLASLYEFPNLEGKLGEAEVQDLLKTEAKPRKLPKAKHVFSHVEWHMSGYLFSLDRIPDGDVLFVEWDEVKEKYPIPSAFLAYKKFLDEYYQEKNC